MTPTDPPRAMALSDEQIAEIRAKHDGCIASGDDLCDVPRLLAHIDALTASRSAARVCHIEQRQRADNLAVVAEEMYSSMHDMEDQRDDLAKEHADCDTHLRVVIEHRDRVLVELSQIRELVGALDDETTIDAVREMATERDHYATEMKRADFETIPTLTADLDAAQEALAASRDLLSAIVDCTTTKSGEHRHMIADGKGRQFSATVRQIVVALAATGTDEPHWATRTCGHPEDVRGLPPTTFRTACRCGQNYACPTCGFGSVSLPHACAALAAARHADPTHSTRLRLAQGKLEGDLADEP